MVNTRRERGSCLFCGKSLLRLGTKYCNNKCQKEFEYYEYIKLWKAGQMSGNKYNGEQVSGHIRRYLLDLYGNKCQDCNWNKVNKTSGKVPLMIEHIDGNSSNTVEANLKLLCPNCHSLTPTYGNLNRGNGRKSRRKG